MSILSRFSDIMRSNINALLDKAEDPAKMVDQMLIDLRRDLADVKKDTASVMADEKAAKRRLDDNMEHAARYEAAARKAIAAGNDGDARELLAKKQQYEGNTPALQQAYDLAHANAEKMRAMTVKLTGDIQNLEMRKDNIKAKSAAAKAQEKMNKMTSGDRDFSASIEAFDRLDEKANKRLDAAIAKAELDSELAVPGNLLSKYEGASSVTVEDELAKLKAEMAQE